MTLIFWVSLGTLLYVYVGYPMLVGVLARLFGHKPVRRFYLPRVSLLIPAYDEEAHIEAKLHNSLALDYPRDRLQIVVASDGSTDRTNAIVKQFASQEVTLIEMPRNGGKAEMLSRVVPSLHGELVVFSDASSMLEPSALGELVCNFADPAVGCVSGLYRLRRSRDLRTQGEGTYWKYETFIKRQESRLDSILGAHGAFYAIRKKLFEPLGRELINDDYLIPMRIVARGYRAVYEPLAVAWEREQTSVEGEFVRRRRIAAGNCQQIVELWGMLNPFHGWVAFCFFSHKVLRTIAPLLMLTLLMASLWLAQPWATTALVLQALLYTSAIAGYICQRRGRMVRWLSPPLYFCLGNLAMLEGLFKYCFNRQRPAWERAR